MANKVLVLGATGNTGRRLVELLLKKGEHVKAASRTGKAVAGAEGVQFDFTDPATIAPALEGVDRMFVLVPGGYLDVVDFLKPTMEAAIAQNIKIVMQTVMGADADDNMPYRQLELWLERSGTPYVILRPNWFTDNFHTYWLEGIKQGVIAVPANDGKSSFVDTRDIAASAAAALTSDAFNGKAFNLTGPEALSYYDAAAILSEVAGREITYTPVDDEAFIKILTDAGVPADYAGFLAMIFGPVREGWTATVTNDVETLTGTPPISVATYARDHAEKFG